MSMAKQIKAISSNPYHVVALIITLFTFFMSALISQRVFERLPHLEDELAYLYQARIFAGGHIVVKSPEPRNAFWQPFVVDSNASGMRFGKYTPGWPALLALGVLIGQTWIINAFLSALTVALVYRLGYDIFSPDVGIIAALLTAFSPMALLLNGTLMSHTAGLFWMTLFFYCYWRMEHGKKPRKWAIGAGLALGALAATRPLTTVGIGLPFIAWSGVRLLMKLVQKRNEGTVFKQVWQTLQPLLILSFFTLILASSIPLFSYAATGDASQNLYELVWTYDKVGFGEGFGRHTHRLSKAVTQTRFDLSLTAADLFGWQFTPIGTKEIDHFQNQSDTYPARGWSFILLPFGAIIGLFAYDNRNRRAKAFWFGIWAVIALIWVLLPVYLQKDFFGFGSFSSIFGLSPDLADNIPFSWFWVIASFTWLFLPLFMLGRWKEHPKAVYTWLMLCIVLGIVLVQMLYWIGSQRYSTRYYYEALSAAAILTALPIAWIAEQIGKKFVYAAFLGLCIFTLYFYSTPRIDALYRYNKISPDIINGVKEHRVNDKPILVIVGGATSGDDRVRWRAYGALMSVTSPYLDSDIVVVRDFGGNRDKFIAQFPDRQVIDMLAKGDYAYFLDELPEGS